MSKKQAALETKAAKDLILKNALLDAAQSTIQDEGYAAATVRNIAQRVGLKHQAVFYYFGSLGELHLALFRRQAEAYEKLLIEALNSAKPLRALFKLISDPAIVRLTLEFMALANHSEALRAEIIQKAKHYRKMETQALARYFKERGIKPPMSPQMLSILTNALARLIVNEKALGIDVGHTEARKLIETSLSALESGAPADAAQELLLEIGG